MVDDTVRPASDDLRQKLRAKVRRLQEFETEIQILEERLEDLKKRALHVRTVEIPEVLEEMGLRNAVTEDGLAVSVKTEVHASLPKEDAARRAAAIEWLRQNGAGGIVKRVVSVPFGRGEDGLAALFKAQAKSLGYDPRDEEWVEPQTLKKHARETLEAGREFPEELFGTYVRQIATIRGK